MSILPGTPVDRYCRDRLPAESDWPELRYDLPELHFPSRLNCATEILDRAASEFGGDRTCLITQRERWTYADLLGRANRIANVLTEDFGIKPGQRIMLRGANTPWLVACWFAVVKVGAVVVTTMPLLRNREIVRLVDLTEPSLLLCDHLYTNGIDLTAQAVPIVVFGSDDEADLLRSAANKPTTFDNVDTAADDIVLLAPTSGTTGAPKATVHVHRDLLAVDATFSRYILKPEAGDVFAGTPPLAFTFGLGGLVVFPLRVGAASFLLDSAAPAALAEAVEKHQISVLFTAPTAYRALLRGGHALSLKSLRRCVSAGEHLPAAVWEEFHQQTGLRIINGIGSTELLHIFIAAADDDTRPGSTGKPVPGYYAEIQDDNGMPVADGQPGRLAVKGPTGCRYLADERQKNYVRNGWNLTGDIFTRDKDGYYWYVSRADDMIVSSGYNIAAAEVEAILDTHPDIVESAVIGIPDDDRGMVVHAAIVLRDSATPDDRMVREIQDYVKANVAPYKYPRSVEFVTSVPRTHNGKLQRYLLRPPVTDPSP